MPKKKTKTTPTKGTLGPFRKITEIKTLLCFCKKKIPYLTKRPLSEIFIKIGKMYRAVLVLTGIELVFFTIACTELCFGFVLKREMSSLSLSSAYTELRPFLLLIPPHR